ncbi:MAG TPA: hypothetical protein VG501_09365 [Rhizomicrobium sp.]|nr:hypothetical protein [Rhizomicrobium sp.]
MNQVNDSARQNMADIRAAFDDLIWFQYGSGSQAPAPVYNSATSFKQASAADLSQVYHAGRRVKAVGSLTGTIYGAISSTSYGGGNQTVTVAWDSGSLANESLTVYLSQAAVTGSPVGANPVLNGAIQAQAGNYAADSSATPDVITCTLDPPLSAHVVGLPIRVKLANAITGTATVTFDPGPGAKDVTLLVNSPNAMRAGYIFTFVYNGLTYQVLENTAGQVQQLPPVNITNGGSAVVLDGTNTAYGGIYMIDYEFGTAFFRDLVLHHQFLMPSVFARVEGGSPGSRVYSGVGGPLTLSISGAPGNITGLVITKLAV